MADSQSTALKEQTAVKNRPAKVSDLHDMKKRLLRSYRAADPGIMEKLERTAAGYNTDQLLNLIIEDMLGGTEDLQGTALMLESEGNLKDASVIAIKRADLLRLIADIVAKKKELHARTGEIDLNSPAFCLFQKLCFERLVDAMDRKNIAPEMKGLLLSAWQEEMAGWDKDLRKQLKELND